MKQCTKCRRKKEFEEFNKHPQSKDGFTAWCKTCTGKLSKSYYLKNKDRVIESVKRSREKLIGWFKEYKSTLKCSKCGFDHPAAIEFHHLDPKKKLAGISNLVIKNRTKEEIFEEISKCIILCSNCHKVLHWEENNK